LFRISRTREVKKRIESNYMSALNHLVIPKTGNF
jgi:hypothetical protein